MAIPMSGPAMPCSNANATPVPDVKAQRTPIHNDRTFPLKEGKYSFSLYLLVFSFPAQFDHSSLPRFHLLSWPISKTPWHFSRTQNKTKNESKY